MKTALKLKTFRLHDPAKRIFQHYFFAFCVVEEIYLVVHGDEAILGLIIFYVVNCY